MKWIPEFSNKIESISNIYEKEEWILKYQYYYLKKLFDEFAINWLYFLLRKNNNRWDKKKYIFVWDNWYFETSFWKFDKKIVPYNQNFTYPLHFSFYNDWTFALISTVQTTLNEIKNFENNIIIKISEKIPEFKFISRNFNTLAKTHEWRISYWTSKINDFNIIKKYFKIIDKILSDIDWVNKIERENFITVLNHRLNFISEELLEVVKSKENIIENINNFHNTLINWNEEEKKYLNWIIRRWTNFIIYKNNWIEYFAPSRYIWYKDANISRHNKERWNWWETNIAISKILWEMIENDSSGTKYLEYCNEDSLNYWKFWYLDSDINSTKKINMKISTDETKLLDAKKQIILYGPPWTGKTYNIRNIIQNHSWENYSDLNNEWRVEFITFHQSFSYEEFIEWIKPELGWDSEEISYKIENGIFKKIVNKAKLKEVRNFNEAYKKLLEQIEDTNDWMLILKTKRWKDFWISINSNENLNLYTWKDKNKQWTLTKESIEIQLENNWKLYEYWESYFYWICEYLVNKCWYKTIEKLTTFKNYYLIIDEINRWNISKIFGELITLLESDKRIWESNEIITKLPYSKEQFWIPSNLFIVATMNTSDKSIVSLDTALRRRFWFKEMLPNYTLNELETKIEWIKLSELLEKINNRIEILLDKDHLIWHSYFMKVKSTEDLKLVIYNEVAPLLEEYFYWEDEKIRLVLWTGLFKKKNFDENLFENKGDFDNDENIYEINKELGDNEFINALKNILNNQTQ